MCGSTNRTGGSTRNTSGKFSFNNTYTRRNDDGITPAGSLGHSWAAFMMGIPERPDAWTPTTATPPTTPYLRATSRTTGVSRETECHLGLRMEYELGPMERYNRMIG